MTLPLAYWIVVLLWTVFGAIPHFRKGGTWGEASTALLPWLAAVIVGWAVFGAPIK